MRLFEGDVDCTNLLPRLLGKNLHGALRRHTVCWHVREQGPLHGAGDVHDTGLRILDELRQVLTVVPVKAHRLEPAIEHSCLILPILGQAVADHHICQHHISHIVPNTSVDKLNTPLVCEVVTNLVADLFTPLVDQVWHILPADLCCVYVEDATCCRHVPSRSVSRSHVQDHVHVLQGERSSWVQKLMIPVAACEESMVLQEINLRALLEVLWLPLRQQVQAQVVIDTIAIAAGRGRPHMQVLVVPMRHDDSITSGLINLRCCNGEVRVSLQRPEQLTCKISFHWVSVIVHEHRILGLQQGLNLQKAGNGGISVSHRHLCVVAKETCANGSSLNVAAAANVGISIVDVHILWKHCGKVAHEFFELAASIFHSHNEADMCRKISIRTAGIRRRHRVRDAR
mmetsp:Transcript_76985/g.156717  ORF Transcript_76985/g.156717 Transcript_76985/m.156717 type:complete len:399 (+) Transcript_76985:696-1892(+)